MLSSHLCLDLRSGLLTSAYACYMFYPCRGLWLDHSNSIRRGVVKLLVMQSSPRFCCFVLRKCRRSPQHLFLSTFTVCLPKFGTRVDITRQNRTD